MVAHHGRAAGRERRVSQRAAGRARRRLMKLALIGAGLVGGSFASALRNAGVVDEVIGFDIDPKALEAGLRRGILTRAVSSASAAAAEGDVIVIAAPVGAT